MTRLRAVVLWPVWKLLKLGDFLFGGLAARAGIRVVGIYLERVGEIGHGLDVFVKMGELGWRPRYRAFVVAPPRRVSNLAYLEYWRPYVHVISSPLASAILEHAAFSRHLHFLPPGPLGDRAEWHREEASVAIGAEWERQGRGPLLRLMPEHVARGRAALRNLGVSDEDWFVALHVREPGYLGEDEASHRWHRNARVETYLPAVEAIIERGGWVVRLGDPTMSKLPELDRVIDYPHLDIRSDWLDVYLAAACKFLLGTTSGMVMVAHTFGVPVAGTNWVPFWTIPRSEHDLYIPKLYRSAADGQTLSFAEMLAPELHHVDDSRRLTELGLEVVDNTEEEIREVTLEMLDRITRRVKYSKEDEQRQEAYRSVFTQYAGNVRCCAGRDFLRRHEDLLPTSGVLGAMRPERVPVRAGVVRSGQAKAATPPSMAILWPVWKLLKVGDFLFGGLVARAGIRFVGVYLERIGEIAAALELYVKMGELGWRPPYRGVVVAPPERVVNTAFLDLWRPYVRIVSSPVLSNLLRHADFSRRLAYVPPGPREDGSAWKDREDAIVAVTAEWDRRGHPPVIRLSAEQTARGRGVLRSLGMPEDAWFIALHVREPGYLGEDEASHRWHRNARVETYLPAVEAIIERGGWVVRLGDPTMSKLPELDRVIDYPHLDIRSDWLDVYLAAACKFLLGTTSGMVMVSQTFGVPIAGTNWVPSWQIPHAGRNIYVPKLYRSVADERLLSFEETLAGELFHLHDTRRLTELGIELVDNAADEIIGLTVELLDRLDGTLAYSEKDEWRQNLYWKAMAHYSSDQRPRVARDFLRKYDYLLPTT